MAIFVSNQDETFQLTNTSQLIVPGFQAGVAGSDGSPGKSLEQPSNRMLPLTHPTSPPETNINDQPPLTNRGALITVPLVNQFLIDWAAFTFKLADPQEVVGIIRLKSELFTEIERGMHGYRKSLRFGNIGIFFDGQENMGCHVNMSGQGCRQYEGQFEVSPWLDLFTAVLDNKGKFTRLDLAQDNVDGLLDLDKLKSAIVNREIRSRFKKASENKNYHLSRDITQSDDGNTLYFGKRSSRVFVRFYDKAAQHEIPFFCNRAEIELKEQRAQKAAEFLAYGQPIGQLFVGILNQYLAIINLDNTNISRCSLQTWWSEWLQSTEKVKLTTAKAVKTVAEAMEYINRQYAPTLAMIKTHLGVVTFNDFIRELIKSGVERMSMKHEQILFLSSQKNADNYSQEQEEYEERAAIMEYDGGLDRKEAEELARLALDKENKP